MLLKVTVKVYPSYILAARRYAENNRVIGAEGTAETTTPFGKFKTKVQIFNKPDGTSDIKFIQTDDWPQPWRIVGGSLDGVAGEKL